MKAPARFTKRSAKGVEFCSTPFTKYPRSEEHTSELQSRFDLVCRLLLEKKKKRHSTQIPSFCEKALSPEIATMAMPDIGSDERDRLRRSAGRALSTAAETAVEATYTAQR